MYEFVVDLNLEFVASHISGQSYSDLNIDTMIVVNASGQAVFARSYDPETQAEKLVSPDLLDALKSGGRFLRHSDPLSKSYVWGLLQTSDGVFSVGSRPILKSSYEGPVRGCLITARRVSQAYVDALGAQLHLACRAYEFGRDMPPDIAPIADRLETSSSADAIELVSRKSERRIAGYAPIRDIYGKYALLLEVETGRGIYQQASAVRRNFALLFLAIGILMVTGLVVVLELLILGRLRGFSGRVRQIRVTRDRNARIAIRGSDELSRLASDVNALMEALNSATQAELEKENRYRQLLSLAPVGIFETDAAGKCVYVNLKWSELTGLSNDLARGDGWAAALHPDDRDRVFRAWTAAAENAEGFPSIIAFNGRTAPSHGCRTASTHRADCWASGLHGRHDPAPRRGRKVAPAGSSKSIGDEENSSAKPDTFDLCKRAYCVYFEGAGDSRQVFLDRLTMNPWKTSCWNSAMRVGL